MKIQFRDRRVVRIFCEGGESRGMLSWEKFRKFGLPWTAFQAFSCWTKRNII